MELPAHLIETVVTAIISGGGGAAASIVAFFQNMKKRLDVIEKKLGSLEEKSGIIFSLNQIETALASAQGFRAEVQSWATHPPEWFVQLVSRLARRSQSFTDPVEYGEFDQLTMRRLERRLIDLEAQLEALKTKQSKFVSEEDFEDADRQRAEDIGTIRTTVAEISGLLKGLQSALGFIKR